MPSRAGKNKLKRVGSKHAKDEGSFVRRGFIFGEDTKVAADAEDVLCQRSSSWSSSFLKYLGLRSDNSKTDTKRMSEVGDDVVCGRREDDDTRRDELDEQDTFPEDSGSRKPFHYGTKIKSCVADNQWGLRAMMLREQESLAQELTKNRLHAQRWTMSNFDEFKECQEASTSSRPRRAQSLDGIDEQQDSSSSDSSLGESLPGYVSSRHTHDGSSSHSFGPFSILKNSYERIGILATPPRPIIGASSSD